MNVAREFLDMITDELDEVGGDLEASKEEVSAYMAERALHLSTISGEPGFAQAVIAERNSVAMRAGLEVSESASSIDQRWLGMIGAALRIAAITLA